MTTNLEKEFNISAEKIQKRNDALTEMMQIEKLPTKLKRILNFYKQETSVMNSDGFRGYSDITNYLLGFDKFYQLKVSDIPKYISLYDIKMQYDILRISQIDTDLRYLVEEIQSHRISRMKKIVKKMDKLFDYGIEVGDTIYRVMRNPFSGNVIHSFSSWSLTPLEIFCQDSECHLYVAKIPRGMKVLYIENPGDDKELTAFSDFNRYEYEFLLPRNLEFREYRTEVKDIENYGSHHFKGNIESVISVTIHYLRLFERISDNINDIDNDDKKMSILFD